MFNHEQFPDLTEEEKSDNSLSNINVGRQGSRHGQMERNPNNSRQSPVFPQDSTTRRDPVQQEQMPPASYSLVAGGATASSSNRTRPNQQQSEKTARGAEGNDATFANIDNTNTNGIGRILPRSNIECKHGTVTWSKQQGTQQTSIPSS
jgi:hypothetical protein